VSEAPVTALKSRIRADLKAAMRARQDEETGLLRMLLAAIDDAEAVPVPEGCGYVSRAFGDETGEVPRRVVTAELLHAILLRERAARHDAAKEMDRVGRPDRAEALRFHAEIVARYL
jgi:uncharacterized protein YqeY